MTKLRQAFEHYLREVHLVEQEELKWDEERNCYVQWRVHFAWQAWRESAVRAVTS